MSVLHLPPRDPPLRSKAVQSILNGWRDAMRLAPDDDRKLLAITAFTMMLARARQGRRTIELIGHSRRSPPSTADHNLDADAVIKAKTKGEAQAKAEAAAAFNERIARAQRATRVRVNSAGIDGDAINVILTLPQFLATLTPPDYLVDGLFKRGFLYSITAMTGAGKTAVALLLALAVADLQRRWKFGPFAVEHGRVLYITRENPEEVKERLIGMAEKLGFKAEELIKTFLVIDSVSDIAKAMGRIKAELEVFGDVALVILDTSAALFVGDDENSSIEMLKHAKTQRSLTKQLPGHPCVVALNHPIKNPTSPEQLLPRGGGGYLNEVDGNLTLWAHDDKLSDLHWTGKLRGPDFEKVTFHMQTITVLALRDAKGRLMPTVMARHVTDQDAAENESKSRFQENRLLAVIATKPEASIADLATACGWVTRDGAPYKSLIVRVIKRLIKAKLIAETGRGHTLTPAGKKATAGPKLMEEESSDDATP